MDFDRIETYKVCLVQFRLYNGGSEWSQLADFETKKKGAATVYDLKVFEGGWGCQY